MTKRQKRMAAVAALVVGLALTAVFGFTAFRKNMMYFYTPSDVVKDRVPPGTAVRLGGMVEKGSLKRLPDGVTISFVVTDNAASVPVRFKGIVPALFREGSGVVADGKFDGQGQFVPETSLAKHDERYMPPEVAGAMHKSESLQK